MTIQVKGLRKKYFNKEAVKGVDFTIEPESIIGLLGRNGASVLIEYRELVPKRI